MGWKVRPLLSPFFVRPPAVHLVVYLDHEADADTPIPVLQPSNRIRLYSIKTFKPLGTLDYHKDGVQALAFARSGIPPQLRPSQSQSGSGVAPKLAEEDEGVADDDDDDDEFSNSEIEARKRWLVAGGKDGRISVWELMDFIKAKS